MILILLRYLILMIMFLYLLYETLFDHYILWIVGFLSWWFLPSFHSRKRVQTPANMALNSFTMNALTPNLQAVGNKLLQNQNRQQNLVLKKPVENASLCEASEYLVELEQIRDAGVRTAKLRELLDAEILFCSKKIKFSALVIEKQQLMKQVLEVEELLRTTSRQVFQEQLQKMLASLKAKIDKVTTQLVKAGPILADVKQSLLQCKESVSNLIDELTEEEAPTSSSDESEDTTSSPSPWLKLCEANTGLDSHLSNLPTSTIENYDWNQSEKFVKLYLDVPGLSETDQAKVSTSFGERNISVFVTGVAGHNYKLFVQDLNEPIDINDSKFRLKKERIVLFLAKKHHSKWTDLTSQAAVGRKQSVDRLLKKMRVVFTEFVGLSALVEPLPQELRSRMLLESGCLVVDDADQAVQALELVQTEPPKLVLFRTRSSEPFADADFQDALNALADMDCYISLHNVQFEQSSHVDEDDLFVQLLENKPCSLVSFCGRLSRESLSLLPAAMLHLKLFISSAEELNALSDTAVSVDTLHLRIKTGMDLKDVKKLLKQPLQNPLHLVFYGIEDSNVDWLIEVVRKILPSLDLANVGTLLIPAWSLELLECRLTLPSHKRLFSELPVDVTAVTVHDRTGDADIASMASGYASRFCKFDVRHAMPSSDLPT